MRIAWDAKRAFHNTTGLGNYSRDLIKMMTDNYPENNYYLCSPNYAKMTANPFHKEIIQKPSIQVLHAKNQLEWYWRSKGIHKDLVANNIDLYHGLSNEIPFIKSSQRKYKLVVSIHDLIFKEHPEFYKSHDRWIYNKKVKFACQEADLIIAMSEQTKKDIIKHYPFAKDKIKVIYQSIHPIFKTQSSKALQSTIRSQYQLPQKFSFMLSAFEKRKNHKVVLEALKSMKDLKIPLVLAGKKGDAFEETLAYIKANDLEQQVFIITDANIETVNAIYDMASLFIQSSLYEGFGIPVLEALTKDLPCIVSDNSSFPEIAKEAALYFNPMDSEALKQQWEKLWQDESLQNKLVQKIEINPFEKSYLSQELYNIYQSLI